MEVETEGGEQQGMASQSSAAVEKHVQTDLAARDIECLCQQCLDTQVLSEKLKYHVFDVDSAASDETRLSFYTGLPGDIVDALAELVCPYLIRKSSLAPFQQLILTLMKLRLGLSQADLGYWFQISQSTVSWPAVHTIQPLGTAYGSSPSMSASFSRYLFLSSMFLTES